MRIAKLGHACLLLEDGATRLLVDPGVFSPEADGTTGLAGVLVTHQHADHLDLERLRRLLDANPDAAVWADDMSAAQLGAAGIAAIAVHAGDEVVVGEWTVRGVGEQHAVIHPELPPLSNVGYLIDGRVFHPGDALTVPDTEVQVLALPLVAPWMAAREAVDYLRAVRPAIAVPIHDAITAAPYLYDNLMRTLGPAGTRYERIDGQPLSV